MCSVHSMHSMGSDHSDPQYYGPVVGPAVSLRMKTTLFQPSRWKLNILTAATPHVIRLAVIEIPDRAAYYK